MRILIADRLRPYTHSLGARCLLPGTSLACEIFPTRISIWDLSKTLPKHLEDINIDLEGPVADFTVLQELEKGHIDVFGQSQKGYFRYLITGRSEGGLQVVVKKFPECSRKPEKELYCEHTSPKISPIAFENLSFGCSKAQEWPAIRRRSNLQEILPFWYRLGLWSELPNLAYSKPIDAVGGAASLLAELEKHISDRNLVGMESGFQKLLSVGFEGMFSPRYEDGEHQGILLPPVDVTSIDSPLLLLSYGQKLIRSMLISSSDSEIDILPALLPELHCGRLLNVELPNVGRIDLEWSKKTIRRIAFHPSQTNHALRFIFHKGISACRLQVANKGIKQRYCSREPFDFICGKSYFFDNFT